MIFKSGKVYDFLKWLALVALDAIGIAYSELSVVWGLPYGDEIAKTCTIVSILLGALIGVSSIKYQALQEEVVEEVEEG